jgi:hypothetical protein
MPLSPERVFANVLPELRDAEALLRKNASQHGITYNIADFGGLRTQADTVKIMQYRANDYAEYLKTVPDGQTPTPIDSWRPIAPFGVSYHNYGAAFDVNVTAVPAGRTLAWGLAIMKNAAPAVGLRSDIPSDPPHFELPITLSDAKGRWALFMGTPSGSSSVGVVLALAALGALVAFAIHHARHGGG